MRKGSGVEAMPPLAGLAPNDGPEDLRGMDTSAFVASSTSSYRADLLLSIGDRAVFDTRPSFPRLPRRNRLDKA